MVKCYLDPRTRKKDTNGKTGKNSEISRPVHLKQVRFTVCKLFFNKPVFKKKCQPQCKIQLVTRCYLDHIIIWGVNYNSLSFKNQEISSKTMYRHFP